jgi:hypothetical protein
MTRQQEFDHLRQERSGALAEFITAAHQTERQMQNLHLPIGLDEDREVLSQQRAEVDACYIYITAARKLTDFVRQQLELIQ